MTTTPEERPSIDPVVPTITSDSARLLAERAKCPGLRLRGASMPDPSMVITTTPVPNVTTPRAA
ncbi:MAG: hypothetical protein AAF432_07780 [Planctomycetota bacterium]